MKKLLLIIPAVIILIVSITLVLTKKTDNPKQVLQDNKIEETSKIKEVSTMKEDKEETIEENKKQEVKQEENKETKNIEQKQTTNNSASETKIQEQSKTETVQPAPVQTQPVQQPEPVREQTEWEKLGISEYDYYNSPMWSWARVDYSVKTYGSLEATHQACVDAGNQMEDITSFTCNNINSYSGDYLGDMLKVRY